MRGRRFWIFSGAAVALLLLIGAAQAGSTLNAREVEPETSSSANDSRDADRLRATVRAQLKALVAGDVTAARRLMADDFQLINPAGGSLTREEYLGGVAAGDIDFAVLEPTSPIVVRLYERAAAVRYQQSFDLVAFGLRLRHQGWVTGLYERRHGGWQVVWEQSTAVPNNIGLFLESIRPTS